MIMGAFSKTVDIATFASTNGITKLELVKNPNTGKLFIATDTGLTMRSSAKITSDADLNASLQVSWFTPDNGDASWMLHPKGESGQNVVGSMSFAPATAKIEAQV
jgi:hypothetical protein